MIGKAGRSVLSSGQPIKVIMQPLQHEGGIPPGVVARSGTLQLARSRKGGFAPGVHCQVPSVWKFFRQRYLKVV